MIEDGVKCEIGGESEGYCSRGGTVNILLLWNVLEAT